MPRKKQVKRFNNSEKALRELYRDNKKQFPAFAWPGAYPVIYITGSGDILCSDCATKEFRKQKTGFRERRQGFIPVGFDVFYEGPMEFCAECSKEIESAYGDPEESAYGDPEESED